VIDSFDSGSTPYDAQSAFGTYVIDGQFQSQALRLPDLLVALFAYRLDGNRKGRYGPNEAEPPN
jgi:hypothetical protein